MENKLVEFKHVTKNFNAANQIEDISFSIHKGEIFALCGGNGAGKSTVIKMLIGVLSPSSGEVMINGERINKKNQSYKGVFSYMPDAMVFPSQLTGKEIMVYYANLNNVPALRVEELLERVGLKHDENKKVKYYSKGMQQRLALAQCLLPKAPLLILDEPTNGLDPYWVREFKRILKEEKAAGTTILFSSHILADVQEITDRIAFMDRGSLLVVEEVSRLIEAESASLEEIFFKMIKRRQTH